MKKFLTSVVFASIATSAIAEVPHTFKAGEKIEAAKVNENFAALSGANITLGSGEGTTYDFFAHGTETQIDRRVGHRFDKGTLVFTSDKKVQLLVNSYTRFMAEKEYSYNTNSFFEALDTEKETNGGFDGFCGQGQWALSDDKKIITLTALVTDDAQCGEDETPTPEDEITEHEYYEGTLRLTDGGTQLIGNITKLLASKADVEEYKADESFEKELEQEPDVTPESVVWSINGFIQ